MGDPNSSTSAQNLAWGWFHSRSKALRTDTHLSWASSEKDCLDLKIFGGDNLGDLTAGGPAASQGKDKTQHPPNMGQVCVWTPQKSSVSWKFIGNPFKKLQEAPVQASLDTKMWQSWV